jgi:hypothetical protein
MGVVNVLTSIGTLGAVVTALAIAVFGETMASWFFTPRLTIEYNSEPPFCHKTLWNIPGQTPAECYYLRIKIANTGKRKATSVEVLAARLMKRNNDGDYEVHRRYLPMHLLWSHSRRVAESIDPTRRNQCVGEYFTIGFEEMFARNLTSETILSLDTEVKPTTSNHLLVAGSYSLEIMVGSENAKTVRTEIDIRLTGTWHTSEAEMFKEGITVAVSE